MKYLRPHARRIAAFFIIQIVISVVYPTVSWALTSGPATPEATSFEPVDTTDMVNPLTGDLAYNIPLLEVPGPAGGYPLSLSYHAGIMTNEDASWVGLGWSLNPGAINRSVSGWADDHKDIDVTNRFYWDGGESQTVEVGATLGIAGVAGVSAGVSLGHDTYQGFGVGGFVGANIGVGGDKSPLGIGLNAGVDPWGSPYASAGLSASFGSSEAGALNLSTGVGLATNFKSVSSYASAGASVSYGTPTGENGEGLAKGTAYLARGGASLVGASISSSGGGFNYSVAGGQASGQNSKAGKVSIRSSGFTLPIPFVHLGYKYQRYWIDQTDIFQTNGMLNYNKSPESEWEAFISESFDTYHLLDPTMPGGIVEYPEAEEVMGGSFPDVDSYSVVAQGLSGQIQPYKNLGYLQQRTKRDKNSNGWIYPVVNYELGVDDHRVEFRFIGDFSNRHIYEPDAHPILNSTSRALYYSFNENQRQTGENNDDGFINNRLAGSKHIEYWSNYEIGKVMEQINGTESNGPVPQEAIDRALRWNYVESNNKGFSRNSCPSGQIGAYIITNASGVKYHFTLPAYSYDEYQFSRNTEKGENSFTEVTRPEKYAYTWHLTAITGPDYVDRGGVNDSPNGKLDSNDWGYWVAFDYGKWTDQYFWRNPGEGLSKDLDQKFESFSEGTKEIYYLNSIRTQSHTAYFIKDVREDALSSTKIFRNIKAGTNDWQTRPNNGVSQEQRDGGFNTLSLTQSAKISWAVGDEYNYRNYTTSPTKSLKLFKIILIENSQYPNEISASYGDWGFTPTTFSWNKNWSDMGLLDFTFNQHRDKNVIDREDIEPIEEALTQSALRIIELDTDYSLAPNTSNSSQGKLTLKEVSFLGKVGFAGLPSMKFDYDLEEPVFSATLSGASNPLLSGSDLDLAIGDILKSGSRYYLVKSEVVPTQEYILRQIVGSPLGGGPSGVAVTMQKTKNPPYGKNMYDIWGYYKSDFNSNYLNLGENLARMTTKLSGHSVDVWSLRRISTSIGTEILLEYASDSYSDVFYELSKPYIIVGQNPITEEDIFDFTFTIKLSDTIDEEDFQELFHVGDTVGMDVIITGKAYYFNEEWIVKNGSCSSARIVDIDERYIKLKFGDNPGGSECIPLYGMWSTPSYLDKWVISGNIYPLNKDVDRYGGGLRTTGISLRDFMRNKRSTVYNYSNGDTSAGICSYEPYGMDQYVINPSTYSNVDNTEKFSEGMKIFKTGLYEKFSSLLANSRELPPPGVFYGHVSVSESIESSDGIVTQLPTYNTYEFNTYFDQMVEVDSLSGSFVGTKIDDFPNGGYTAASHQPSVAGIERVKRKSVTVTNAAANLGTMKRMTLWNREGHKLSETENLYLYDTGSSNANYKSKVLSQFRGIGMLEESYVSARLVKTSGDMTINIYGENKTKAKYELLGIVSKRRYLPNIQLGSTTTNYKTGITTTSRNLAFDFYSGEVTTTYAEDGYGNKYVSHAVPAYRLKNGLGVNDIAYPGMGLAMNGGKNMLTQEGASYSYMVANDFNPDVHNYETKIIGVVGASVQTWSDDNDVLDGYTAVTNYPTGIYRKKATYSFIGDNSPTVAGGLFNPASFSEATLEQDNTIVATTWQKNAEITLYDVNSHALEATDINGNYAATRLDAKNERVISTVANARFGEFTASGFESTNEGDVIVAGTLSDGLGTPLTKSHSGGKMVKTTGAQMACSYTGSSHSPRKYKVSFWSSSPTVQVVFAGNNTPKVVGTYGSWYLMEALVDVSAGNFTAQVKSLATGTTDVYFDDFRVHPVDATMTSYVYNTWGELSDILDANNLFTHYEYDGMGRLKSVSRETLKYGPVKTSEITITHANQN